MRSIREETLDLLLGARELISQPGQWTHGSFSRDKDGNCVGATSELAASWCGVGAVLHFKNDFDRHIVIGACRMLDYRAKIRGFHSMIDANDGSKFLRHQVYLIYDDTIRSLQNDT